MGLDWGNPCRKFPRMKTVLLALAVLTGPCVSRAANSDREQPGSTASAQDSLTVVELGNLAAAEKSMFEIMGRADEQAFLQIAGDDYFTINADGVALDRAGALKLLSKFKGSTSKRSEQRTRIFGHTAVLTGRGKFYFKSLLVAEVLYSQVWVLRDGRWQFVNWTGTMTGLPSWYPVIFTGIVFLGLILLVRWMRRKKKAAT